MKPFQLLGMDFIGPLPQSEGAYWFILHIIDYFSWYSWTYPCITANKEETIKGLKDVFLKFATPVAIYADIGQHFDNKEVKAFLEEYEVILIPSPSGSSKSTGRVEKANDILQQSLKKSANVELKATMREYMNTRED